MKKITLLFLFFSSIVFSQKGISYQALIIDPVTQELPGVNNIDAPLANKDICLRFSFIDESDVLEYEEVWEGLTDSYGMVNLIIGTETKTGGYAASFEDIVWSALAKNLKIELSADDSCLNFIEISNAPFTAVPFALFAVNTQNTSVTIAAGAVTTTEILDGTIATADIAAGAVTTTEILDGTIATADIAAGAVTTTEILDGTIATVDIAAGAVTTTEILDGTITAVDIATDAVTTTEILDGTIATADIAAGAVTTTEILDGTITAVDIATDAVTTTEILDGTIATADIATDAVTTTEILDATIVDADVSATAGIVYSKLAFSDNIVAADIATDAVTTAEILDATIVVGDLADDAVETIKIKDLNVTNAKLDKTNIPLSGFAAAAADVDLGANKLTDVADPTAAQDAATKAYVDAEVTTINTLADGTIYLGDTNGDAQEVTMNGDVTIDNAGATTIATGAVTDTKLDKTNIPLSGFAAAAADVDLGANKLTDVADPTAAQDAATKAYVDAEVTTINTLADGTIYLGDTNGDAQEVTMNGDVTIDNAGATTIATGAVTDTKLDKTNIPLSGFAAAAADVDLGANKLTDVADPTAAQDAATKAYVDTEITNGTATNVSGTVAVVNGGTGATTAALARNNLGLYTGVYSIAVTSAASITIPFASILPSGVIPTINNMTIFFSNIAGLLIMQAFLVDTDFDTVNDSFKVEFNTSQTGTLKISYYIGI